MPKTKMDLEACSYLEYASDEEITPYLAELVEWLADSNWPVASAIILRLERVDERLASHLIAVLQGQDDGAKYFLLSGLLLSCMPSVRTLCMDAVVRIFDKPTQSERREEVHLVAGDVVALYSFGNNQ